MLMKVLKKISEKKGFSISKTAQELGVSKAVVEQMIDNLINMGYVKKVSFSCESGGCKGCSHSSSCSTAGSPLNILELTNKGKEMIE